MTRWLSPTLVLLLVVASLGACSFVYSSKSSSDSVASSSASISSSSPQNREAAYRDDVRDYTYAYVISGGDPAGFEAKLGTIAEKHGITNWQANQATYVGIGQGLGKAKAKPIEVEAFKQNLSHGDATKAKAIQQGYDQITQ